MSKKVIKLKESDIRDAIKKALNEISYHRADDVAYTEGNKFEDLKDDFDEFYNNLLYNYGKVIYPKEGYFKYAPADTYTNKYIAEIMKHATIINDILERKVKQASNINKTLQQFDYDKYRQSPEGEDEEHDYKEVNYLINKYPKG